jgi:hypothetical protein
MKAGRLCRNCSVTVHKKCEDKFNSENICTHEHVQPKSTGLEDDHSMISTDDIDSQAPTYRFSTKAAATAAISAIDSTARRSFRGFVQKQNSQTSTFTLLELSKNDELDYNSSPSLEKRFISTPPIQKSSKIANAASSAYSKLREFKTRRAQVPSPLEARKPRSSSESSTDF